MNIYLYKCAHGTSYQITEWNSRITNSLALVEFSQHHTIHRVMANLKSSTNTRNQHWRSFVGVIASYRITLNLAMAESPFFLVYGRDPNLPWHQLLEPMQCFLGYPDSCYAEPGNTWISISNCKEDIGWEQVYSHSEDNGKRQTSLPHRRPCIFQKQAAW